MASMKDLKCGGNPDDANGVELDSGDHNISQKKKLRKMIFICVCIFVGICIVGYFYSHSNAKKYLDAVKCIENQQYEEAVILFSSIENYKDSAMKIKDARFFMANDALENGEYEEALEQYLFIDNYEGAEEKINEAKYKIFMTNIQDKEFYKSMMIMKSLSTNSEFYNECCEAIEEHDEEIINELKNVMLEGKFEEVLEGYKILQKVVKRKDLIQEIIACEDMIHLKGDWYEKNDGTSLKVDGWNMYLDGEQIALESSMYQGRFAVKSKDGVYVLQYNSDTQVKLIKDGSPYIYVSEEKKGERVLSGGPPAIGMTREEVEKSSWGKPEDINKTTYAWGVTEQWCYPGYRYIYFDDGIVTAIQE